MSKSLPGLFLDVSEHLEKLGITDLRSVSKWTYKRTVTKYVRQTFFNELLESVRKYKKLNYEEISKLEFKRKTYFSTMNLESGRMAFRVAAKMVNVPANFPSKYRRRGESIACSACAGLPPPPSVSPSEAPPAPPILSQSHLLSSCVAVSDIRSECNLNLEDTESVALFFRKVMARNMEIERFDTQM